METQEPTPTPRKSYLPYVIGVSLLVLLAAASFIAVRYFNQQRGNMTGGPGENEIVLSGSDGFTKSFSLDIEPAKELPVTEPEVRGIFVERKDNSIFVGTGDVTMIVKGNPVGSESSAESSHSGPTVEVVVSTDTKVYRDVTELDPDNPEATVQQKVELSTIDEITQQTSITVWGRKVGDRVIADVLMFSTPFMMKTPGPGAP
jgi:hypothetical protein